jgi:FkbM family methyltransferase
LSLVKLFMQKANSFRKVRLPLWLQNRETTVPLFGYSPGIKTRFIPSSDPIHKALEKALKRSRAFPYDLAVFRKVELESEYLQYLADRGKTSLDIGANVGFYAAVLSPLSARVIVFEANPNLQPYLSLNLHRFGNVYVLPIAVFSKAGDVTFNIPRIAGGDAVTMSAQGGILNLFINKMGIESVRVSVPAVAVDSLALDNVGLIKIDVEGNEFDVLEGAAETIQRCRPNIVVENEYRHNPDCSKVFEFLSARDYAGYFVDRSTFELKSFDEFSIEHNQKALLDENHQVVDMTRYVFNFMFVPREKDRLKTLLGSRQHTSGAG